ncbi:serine hydrolase [Polyangium fumosum]|uniref:serine hydrolase n=1 Tax=Polyangium fumosum TaxID=889272 RepID=UPI001B870F5B|nr:serine hydrolase [Polyangium fumosum]
MEDLRTAQIFLHPKPRRPRPRRPDERFAMCSTFKWALAAAVLARVDHRQPSLDERVPYGSTDLLEHAPITREHVAEGSMTIDALAQAAVTVSDNTAANLLLAKVGGPASFTQFVRQQGDAVTRLDRDDPQQQRSRRPPRHHVATRDGGPDASGPLRGRPLARQAAPPSSSPRT